jgi:hypothetical protein
MYPLPDQVEYELENANVPIISSKTSENVAKIINASFKARDIPRFCVVDDALTANIQKSTKNTTIMNKHEVARRSVIKTSFIPKRYIIHSPGRGQLSYMVQRRLIFWTISRIDFTLNTELDSLSWEVIFQQGIYRLYTKRWPLVCSEAKARRVNG